MTESLVVPVLITPVIDNEGVVLGVRVGRVAVWLAVSEKLGKRDVVRSDVIEAVAERVSRTVAVSDRERDSDFVIVASPVMEGDADIAWLLEDVSVCEGAVPESLIEGEFLVTVTFGVFDNFRARVADRLEVCAAGEGDNDSERVTVTVTDQLPVSVRDCVNVSDAEMLNESDGVPLRVNEMSGDSVWDSCCVLVRVDEETTVFVAVVVAVSVSVLDTDGVCVSVIFIVAVSVRGTDLENDFEISFDAVKENDEVITVEYVSLDDDSDCEGVRVNVNECELVRDSDLCAVYENELDCEPLDLLVVSDKASESDVLSETVRAGKVPEGVREAWSVGEDVGERLITCEGVRRAVAVGDSRDPDGLWSADNDNVFDAEIVVDKNADEDNVSVDETFCELESEIVSSRLNVREIDRLELRASALRDSEAERGCENE